ncbi:MAG: hypothetical protein WCS69_06160 [Ignavibacteriaceae bacterium]|jgi:hypothetical protein
MEESIFTKKEGLKDFFPECQLKEVANGKIYQCLVENPTCTHYFHFGSVMFCKHPLRNQFTPKNVEKPSASMFAKLDLGSENN